MRRFIGVVIFLPMVLFSLSGKVFAHDITLKHRIHINRLYILDQVSESLPEFYSLPEYKNELGDIFDSEDLAKYKQIRSKHQVIPKVFTGEGEGEHLFAPQPTSLQDPIVDAFFMSENYADAMKKLQRVITADEARFIETIFEKYATKFKDLESKYLAIHTNNLQEINDNIDGDSVDEHLRIVRDFYHAANNQLKSSVLLWSPNENGFGGNAYGEHLIIRMGSKKIPNDDVAKMLVSVIVHEATHFISGNAPQSQKTSLSNLLISKVNIDSFPDRLLIIEEPLVMATQMAFVDKCYPGLFIENKEWFNHPMAAKLYPILKQYFASKKGIDENFIESYAVLLT